MLDNKLHETITALSIVNNPVLAPLCPCRFPHSRRRVFIADTMSRIRALSLSLSLSSIRMNRCARAARADLVHHSLTAFKIGKPVSRSAVSLMASANGYGKGICMQRTRGAGRSLGRDRSTVTTWHLPPSPSLARSLALPFIRRSSFLPRGVSLRPIDSASSDSAHK